MNYINAALPLSWLIWTQITLKYIGRSVKKLTLQFFLSYEYIYK